MNQVYGYQVIGPVYQALNALGGGGGATVSGFDHGQLGQLLDDDHTQYLLTNGGRQLTGDWDFGSFTISGTGDIYCDNLHTSSGSLYIGDLHLTYNGSHLIVPAELDVTGDIGNTGDFYMHYGKAIKFGGYGKIGVDTMEDLLEIDQDKVTINGDFVFDDNTISGTIGNIITGGNITANTYHGDGSNLTSIDHDSLDGFVANEHIDWTNTNQNLRTTGDLFCTAIKGQNSDFVQIRFTDANTMTLYCGAKEYLKLSAFGDLVINDSGHNNNGLRCESDNNANMLKVDSFNDRVGIGDGSPSYTLDVAGEIRAQTNYRSADGTEGASGWYDDGTNFRITVKNGLITNIGPTVSGGYSMS